MAANQHLVAVYGTLRRGCGNHSWALGDAEFVGRGRTAERFAMYDLGCFPGIKNSDTGGPVVVEVYRVSPAAMSKLDRLESNGRLYIRRQSPVILDDGAVVEAWLYIYNRQVSQGCSRILCGDWSAYKRRKMANVGVE